MKRWLTATGVVAITMAALSAVALAASSPAVTTHSASSVKQESAVLNGTINPNGSATTYFFQWGLDQNYGVNGATHSAGSGTKDVNVHETASGLIPGTTYHYRLVATNKFGTSTGTDHTFKTAGHPPPGVTTGPSTQIGQNSATVTGVINPNGQSTSWSFQWGVSTIVRIDHHRWDRAPRAAPPSSCRSSCKDSPPGRSSTTGSWVATAARPPRSAAIRSS